jgi:DNA polymerase
MPAQVPSEGAPTTDKDALVTQPAMPPASTPDAASPVAVNLSVEGSAWDRHAPQQETAMTNPPAQSAASDVSSMPVDPELNARIAQMDWPTLRAELKRRSRPPATQGVFGVGPDQADLFVIGEAPGADEDRLGEPFVGRAGKLLDAMLGAIQHDRSRNVYIANICKFRPPNNRDPRPEEISEDIPILLRQIELVQPKLLLAVGRIAAQTLLESTAPIGKLRGKVHQHASSNKPLVVTYHPAYLLRSPLQKAKAWDDLKIVRDHLLSA